jgi:hypothetical protein
MDIKILQLKGLVYHREMTKENLGGEKCKRSESEMDQKQRI